MYYYNQTFAKHKRKTALDNAGANALFGFPIFCYPWGKNDVLRPSVL
jgi:hypothetical protein